MQQILQSLSNGETLLEDVPAPQCRAGHLKIRTHYSLISPGTERMLLEFGKGSLLQKARSQPDKVAQVMNKVKTDGLMPTFKSVKNKLSQPLPLGYSNVGEVVEVGEGVDGFKVGDLVVSNGQHAQVVVVPKNLCARIPREVSQEHASFTVLGAIALQSIRLVNPTLGETVVVVGLGIIGLLAVQILRANGCKVVAVDLDESKLKLADSFGAHIINLKAGEDPVAITQALTNGFGVDAVLLAAATKSDEPIHQAANMCRKRGRIVLVGVVGLALSRADFYEKELSFQVSCSYGPGRYDPSYEAGGLDYPSAYVRWTEQRNFEAFLGLLADQSLLLDPLISKRIELQNAPDFYQNLGDGQLLGVLIRHDSDNYDWSQVNSNKIQYDTPTASVGDGSLCRIGFIGAGQYASSTLVPAFANTSATLAGIASLQGVSATRLAKRFGMQSATTHADALLSDESIDAVVISTQHDSHAHWILAALAAGKSVFVEKPLALTLDECEQIETFFKQQKGHSPILVTGFNRRYSPLISDLQKVLCDSALPCSIQITVNAGKIPADHWTQDLKKGGGRLIGEACHFVDLARFLAGVKIQTANVVDMLCELKDSFAITLQFENGSIANIHYLANGHKSIAKERIEVFCGGSVIQIDNFKSLKVFGGIPLKNKKLWSQDKGQSACANAFVMAIQGKAGQPLISLDQQLEVSRTCIKLSNQLFGIYGDNV